MNTASAPGPAARIGSPREPETASLTFSGDWVESFMAWTADVGSPKIFTKWAAICTIAGALERKVWIKNNKGDLYPNLYVFFCAPPGVGKTDMTWRVRQLWEGLETHHVARSSVTKAALIDEIAEATRNLVIENLVPPVVSFNCLLVAQNELGVLLPAYDTEFMNTLTDIYDNKGYSESRRTNAHKIDIPNASMTLMAACTPSFLRETLPPGAWDQGFLSRVLIIYAHEQTLMPLFSELEEDDELAQKLQQQLGLIANLYGKFSIEQDAKEFFEKWYLSGQEPRPAHPRLTHYCSRRGAHALKLSMIASVSQSLALVITKAHIQQALDWMVEAEFYMQDIFKAMQSGGDIQIIEDTFHHLYTIYMKEDKRPVGQNRLVHFLLSKTPSNNVAKILEMMEQAGMIKKVVVPNVGVSYAPMKYQKF